MLANPPLFLVSLPDTVKQEIRRERNKMHAKATRERKKAFLEAMELAILVVERENGVLMGLLGGDTKDSVAGTIVIGMAQVKADQLKILYGEDEVEEAVYTGWEAAAQAARSRGSPATVAATKLHVPLSTAQPVPASLTAHGAGASAPSLPSPQVAASATVNTTPPVELRQMPMIPSA